MFKKSIAKQRLVEKINIDFNDIYRKQDQKPEMGAQGPIDLKEVRSKIKAEHKKSQKFFNRSK